MFDFDDFVCIVLWVGVVDVYIVIEELIVVFVGWLVCIIEVVVNFEWFGLCWVKFVFGFWCVLFGFDCVFDNVVLDCFFYNVGVIGIKL